MAKRNRVFEFLHGREYTHDGIRGVFEHVGEYPYEKLYHNPIARGRRTPQYKAIKAQLGDDWSTDMTDLIETYCKAALELGYKDK
jgi:hypothetical protein